MKEDSQETITRTKSQLIRVCQSVTTCVKQKQGKIQETSGKGESLGVSDLFYIGDKFNRDFKDDFKM